MNAEHKRGKGPVVIYRKDGKTPDLRYKSSREYVLSQELEKNKNAQKDWKTTDLKYKGLRDHVLSKHTEINRQIPVQIKPVGKKPIWKTSG